MVDGHVAVGQGLRLDALGSVHHQQRSLAGGQGAADLIGEVHMAGRVDQVQGVGFAVLGLVVHAHGLALDGNAALALQLHAVQNLIHHFPLLKYAGFFQNAVGQGGLAVVDMRDNAKIADF